MTEPLIRFFEVKGRFDEGLQLLDTVANASAPAPVLIWRAILLSHKGQRQEALETAAALISSLPRLGRIAVKRRRVIERHA